MRWLRLPEYYSYPILVFLADAVIDAVRVFSPNSVLFYNQPSKVDYLVITLVKIPVFVTYSTVQMLLSELLCRNHKRIFKTYHLPRAYVNAMAFLFYALHVTVGVFGVVLSRELLSVISVDHMYTYIIHVARKGEQGYYESGRKAFSVMGDIAQHAIQSSLGTIITLVLSIALTTLVYIAFSVVAAPKLLKSFRARQYKEYRYISVANEQSNLLGAGEQGTVPTVFAAETRREYDIFRDGFRWRRLKIVTKRFRRPLRNPLAYVQYAVSLVTSVLFICFLAYSGRTPFVRYAPPTWSMLLSGQRVSISRAEYDEQVRRYRAERADYLGEKKLFFLDTRDSPRYPLVVGPIQQYCSYNPWDRPRCASPQPPDTQAPVETQPNVLLLLVESFSPSPRYVNETCMQPANRDRQVLSGLYYYDGDVMPNLNKLAESGMVMPATASAGVPTAFGLLGVLTTEKPKLRGVNVISSQKNHEEALARKMRAQLGYYTSFTAPTPLEFDQLDLWLFDRGHYDEVHYYFPDDEQAALLGLEDDLFPNQWLPDRISARITNLVVARLVVATGRAPLKRVVETFRRFYGNVDYVRLTEYLDTEAARLQGSGRVRRGQPLFITHFNVDTHSPFTGFDRKQTYTHFRHPDDGTDSYKTMLRAADNYLSEIIRFFSSFDNNTLVVVTGDHGQHEEPVLRHGGEKLNGVASMDRSHQFRAYGNDVVFTTSSVLATMDMQLARNLKLPTHVVLQTHFDHDDLIHTLENMIFEAAGRPYPVTGRIGVDARYIATHAQDNVYLSQKLSTSYSGIFAEFRRGNRMYRGNSLSSAGGVVVDDKYPTFIRYNDGTPVPTAFGSDTTANELYVDGIGRQHLLSYLSENNMLWHYQFEDAACGYNPATGGYTACELPTPQQADFLAHSRAFLACYYLVCIILGGAAIAGALTGVLYCVQCCCRRRTGPQSGLLYNGLEVGD